MGSIPCSALGFIVKWVGTLILVAFGFTLHEGLIVCFLFWDANPEKELYFTSPVDCGGRGMSFNMEC